MNSVVTLKIEPNQAITITISGLAEILSKLMGANTNTPSGVVMEHSFTLAQQGISVRTYHMGSEPTPGRGYDDRLTMRMGCSENTAYKYLGLPEHKGGIRHQRLGKKYIISEQAVREWLGDTPPAE